MTLPRVDPMTQSPERVPRFSVEELTVSIGKGKCFDLMEAFTYTTHVRTPLVEPRPLGVELHIRPFKTDFASIPVLIQLRFDKFGRHNLAAVVHDYLLKHRREYPWLSRRDIDRIFREAMEDLGVHRFDRKWMYWGVRLKSVLAEGREGFYNGYS